MSKGIPARCDPPESSPLLDGWTRPNTASTTTTTDAPIVEDGIVIPASGQLCEEIVTTEPPNIIQDGPCQLYTVQTLRNNTRDAVIEILNCITGELETYTLPPESCLFLYSLMTPIVVDPGFDQGSVGGGNGDGTGSSPGSGNGNGSGNGDGDNDGNDNDNDNDEEEEEGGGEEDNSVVGDTDGDGVPDVGVIIDPPADCEVELPGEEDPPEEAPGGGGTDDGGGGGVSGIQPVPSGDNDGGYIGDQTWASDAGTGGGVTGQPAPSGIDDGVLFRGPQANAMFCQGSTYNPLQRLVTSGNWVTINSVGYGNTEDPIVYNVEDIQQPYTYRPNAIFLHERDEPFEANAFEYYRTFVIDKEIPTIYDNSGLYTYQKHRELAFYTPKQIATQERIYVDPNEVKLMFDNYRNQDVVGNPGYIVVESTVETGDGLSTPMYTFMLSEGYRFNPNGADYNSSGINVLNTPSTLENPQERPYRYVVNGMDFEYGNMKTLSDLLPRNRVITIDGGDIISPEFFSWHVNSGIPIGYGWDSGTYRLQIGSDWLAETHTTYEHKLIPVNIDDDYMVDNHDMIAIHDGFYPRNDTTLDPQFDKLELRPGQLRYLEQQGVDINKIYLEVVTAKSYTENTGSMRPDGSNMIRTPVDDEREFPRAISYEHTKRGLFTFDASGNFIDLLKINSTVDRTPASDYTYYQYEILHSYGPCFQPECEDHVTISPRVLQTDYWDQEIAIVDIVYPSGSSEASNALSNGGSECVVYDAFDCQNFSVSKKTGFNNWQDLVMHGSGYVPIGFYPCTISDKIATMRDATSRNPFPDPDFVPVTTTTEEPQPSATKYEVVGGLFADIRGGCYERSPQIPDIVVNGNTKHVYRWVRPDNFFGLNCEYRITVNSAGQWQIIGFCDDNFGQTTYSTASANGADPNPPTTGWTNGYSLTMCEENPNDNPQADLDVTGNHGGCFALVYQQASNGNFVPLLKNGRYYYRNSSFEPGAILGFNGNNWEVTDNFMHLPWRQRFYEAPDNNEQYAPLNGWVTGDSAFDPSEQPTVIRTIC